MTENTMVVDARESNRYELRLDDGTVAGFAEYGRRGGTTAFVHTVVEDAYGGRGFGSVLVRGALDAERAAGRGVVARCPFVRGWIEKHPDYQDLLTPDQE